MAVGVGAEYERKFLVADDRWRSEVLTSSEIAQGYIAVTEKASVRVRVERDRASVTIKSQAVEGIRRLETDMEVSSEEARELLDELTIASIEKTRHTLSRTPHTWTVDVFAGRNAGLVLLEVESTSEFELVDLPGWVGMEVTGDARYVNSSLSTNPFQAWNHNGVGSSR